jgi:N-acetylmuramic acid 6-phosphate (MurNAc-6-P) etherase
MAETGLDERAASAALAGANDDLRRAIVMIKTGHSAEEAQAALAATGGVIEQAIKMLAGA